MAVPAVFLNGEEFGNGRMTIQDILSKLGSTADASEFENNILDCHTTIAKFFAI
jgi:alkyl hydroperoxide reductase subunit F